MESKTWMKGFLMAVLGVAVIVVPGSVSVAFADDDDGNSYTAYVPDAPLSYWDQPDNAAQVEQFNTMVMNANIGAVPDPGPTIYGAGSINGVYTASFEMGRAPAGAIGNWAPTRYAPAEVDTSSSGDDSNLMIMDGGQCSCFCCGEICAERRFRKIKSQSCKDLCEGLFDIPVAMCMVTPTT